MALERVQMLLSKDQRRRLAELAKARGTSTAEITRQAIDAGLEILAVQEQQRKAIGALKAARDLRTSMPVLNLEVVSDLQELREERDGSLASSD